MSRDCARAFRELLGPDAVADPGPTERRMAGDSVEAVLTPPTAEEVSRVMALACREGWQALPMGLGSWPDGAQRPRNGVPAVAVSTRRMDAVVAYEPADLSMTVEAGTPLSVLQDRARAHGQWLPVDPPDDDRGSVGAMLATGSLGSLAHSFGSPRDLTLGVDLVAGDGRLLHLGGRVVKNVAGFDLVRLTVGSWGALGMITATTLRLFPVPERDVVMALDGGSSRELDAVARTVVLGPVEPAAVQVAERHGRVALLVRFLGSRAEVEDLVSFLPTLAPGPWRRLEDTDARNELAALRAGERGSAAAFRLSLLPSKVTQARRSMAELSETLATSGLEVSSTVYDAKTGVLRASMTGPESGGVGDNEPLASAIVRLRRYAEGEGGSVRITHGPAELIEECDGAWGSVGASYPVVERILRAFDPGAVLPGDRFQP